MDREFWLQRWERGETGFHQPEINPNLERFWPRLRVPPGGTVLVPLCGKSLDMAWFLGHGYRVLGVELSSRAVEQFFREHGLEPRRELRGAFIRYVADGIVLLAGDFFALQQEHIADVSAVYDRASLIALPERMRERYAQRMAELLPACVPTLLISLEYPPDQMQGPPFPVSEPEVRRLYEASFSVDTLLEEDALDQHPQLRARGLRELRERAYWLLRR